MQTETTTTIITNFGLMRLIRDAQSTRKGERALLEALALRCDPKKKYVAWPTYARLVKDTGLCLATLRNSARKLEKAGLIRRTQRTDSANRWHINVQLLADQAAAVKAREMQQAKEDDAPFPDFVPSGNAEAADDGSDSWICGAQ